MNARSMMILSSMGVRLPCIAILLDAALACGNSSSPSRTEGGAQGGTSDAASTGGTLTDGGTIGSGGIAAGGVVGSGGVPASGGKSGTGGTGSGGTSSLGGITGAGGIGAGGTMGSGGVSSGGTVASGGVTSLGGTVGTGGIVSSGGTTGSGGTPSTGGNSGSGGTTSTGGEYGFTYRSPGTHTESCTDSVTGQTFTIDAPDMDWLCTFSQSTPKGYVYVRSTATAAACTGMLVAPLYTANVAQISIAGVVSPLANAQYNYGGAHNNDYLTFDYQGTSYRYYHSSIGFGFRKCQPMDCLNVYALGTTTLQTEGCAAARTLPEVCVQIKAGGTHAPLVDTFAKCPGDPNP